MAFQWRTRLARPQFVVGDRQHAVRRNHVDAVGLEQRLPIDRHDAHFRAVLEHVDEMAFVLRRQMQDDGKGHAGLVRHGLEELLQRRDTTRRRADRHQRNPPFARQRRTARGFLGGRLLRCRFQFAFGHCTRLPAACLLRRAGIPQDGNTLDRSPVQPNRRCPEAAAGAKKWRAERGISRRDRPARRTTWRS